MPSINARMAEKSSTQLVACTHNHVVNMEIFWFLVSNFKLLSIIYLGKKCLKVEGRCAISTKP